MEERRYRPAVAAIGGKMYILGGEEGWDRYHGSIECYDPATGMYI
jgi:Kelch motif